MNAKIRFFRKLIKTVNDNRSLIPRIIVGLVFLSEGIQKFLYPEIVGVGRFAKSGSKTRISGPIS